MSIKKLNELYKEGTSSTSAMFHLLLCKITFSCFLVSNSENVAVLVLAWDES